MFGIHEHMHMILLREEMRIDLAMLDRHSDHLGVQCFA